MKKFTKVMSIVFVLILCVQLFTVSASAYATVQKGSSGSDVKTLQTMLNKVDKAGLEVDGKFGSATQTAVKNFQKRNNLDVDGIVGPKTWAALSAAYNNTTTTTTKAASTLKIGSGKYNPGTLTKGSSYSISGNITSNYKITSVTVGVYKKNGSATSQVKTVNPNAKSYNISKVDSYIKFGSLSAGSYYFKVIAKDASGKTKTLVNNAFTVKAPATNAASTLKIGSGKYNPGTLTKGSSYSISGNITSNYKITSVTVGVYKKNGSATSQVKTVNPNATSYNISKADSYIKFGSLSAGSYYFRVIAKDASNTTKTLVNKAFTVKAASTTTTNSTPVVVPASLSGYKKMAESTYEKQGSSECVLTSYAMLVKCKLYTEGKSYSHISKSVIRNSYNGGSLCAYWSTINSNINKYAGTSGTCTVEERKSSQGYTSSQNKTYIINLLKARPEGIVVFFENTGTHAVRVCNYDSTTKTFYVSDPAYEGWKYVPLNDSCIGENKYGGSDPFGHVNRVIYFK